MKISSLSKLTKVTNRVGYHDVTMLCTRNNVKEDFKLLIVRFCWHNFFNITNWLQKIHLCPRPVERLRYSKIVNVQMKMEHIEVGPDSALYDGARNVSLQAVLNGWRSSVEGTVRKRLYKNVHWLVSVVYTKEQTIYRESHPSNEL